MKKIRLSEVKEGYEADVMIKKEYKRRRKHKDDGCKLWTEEKSERKTC